MITLKDYMSTLSNSCSVNANCDDCIFRDMCTADFYTNVIQEYNITADTSLKTLIISVLKASRLPKQIIEDVSTIFRDAGEE